MQDQIVTSSLGGAKGRRLSQHLKAHSQAKLKKSGPDFPRLFGRLATSKKIARHGAKARAMRPAIRYRRGGWRHG
jgi:hypothetical protein